MLMRGVSVAKATLDAVFANMDLLEMVKTAKVPHARPSCLGPFLRLKYYTCLNERGRRVKLAVQPKTMMVLFHWIVWFTEQTPGRVRKQKLIVYNNFSCCFQTLKGILVSFGNSPKTCPPPSKREKYEEKINWYFKINWSLHLNFLLLLKQILFGSKSVYLDFQPHKLRIWTSGLQVASPFVLFSYSRNFTPLCLSSSRCINGYPRHTTWG